MMRKIFLNILVSFSLSACTATNNERSLSHEIQRARQERDECYARAAERNPDSTYLRQRLQVDVQSSPSLAQVSDNNYIDERTRETLLRWHSEVSFCNAQFDASYIRIYPQMQNLIAEQRTGALQIYAALAQRRITFGQANLAFNDLRNNMRRLISAQNREILERTRQMRSKIFTYVI